MWYELSSFISFIFFYIYLLNLAWFLLLGNKDKQITHNYKEKITNISGFIINMKY